MKDHPYYEEVKFAIDLFESNGFLFIGYNDGGDENVEATDSKDIIEAILSVDDTNVYMEYDGSHVNVYFVLGNEPGEAICDWACNVQVSKLVDDISTEVYDHFN